MVQKDKLMLEKRDAGDAFNRLVEIVELLRKECPWDREQTHESLEVCMLEEAYEVCYAIENQDYANLQEELGDVLLQVVFHGEIAKETEFNISDIINSICDKMIRRHPHVFSKKNIKSLDKVLEKWEDIKREEHRYESCVDEVNSVPKNLPALMRSYKVQKKVANIGFDWDNIDGTIDKVHEEVDELIEAFEEGNSEKIEEEFGDLLFSMVNMSRFMNINPEMALMASTEKFIDRFKKMDGLSQERGRKLAEMTPVEMDQMWELVKESYNK